MHSFKLHIVSIIACSDTMTHLLPEILSLVVSGVRLASTSGVMKFEPPPEIILLTEMTSMVYHTAALIIRQSSACNFAKLSFLTRAPL